MATVTERRCDRRSCGKVIQRNSGGKVTYNAHHDHSFDLCPECDRSFGVWLGQHPIHRYEMTAEGEAEKDRHRESQERDGREEMARRRGSAPDSYSAEWG